MKGFELVKREDHWALYNEDGHKIAATVDGCNSKLSIKNCEEIERGYDLDELADEHCNRLYYEGNINWDHYRVHFKLGFQKALSILGDKKFSEDDMLKAIEMYYGKDKIFIEIIQLLQQTEFDVEILMESKDIDELRVDKGSFLKPNDIYKPKLDEDGCLILRRI